MKRILIVGRGNRSFDWPDLICVSPDRNQGSSVHLEFRGVLENPVVTAREMLVLLPIESTAAWPRPGTPRGLSGLLPPASQPASICSWLRCQAASRAGWLSSQACFDARQPLPPQVRRALLDPHVEGCRTRVSAAVLLGHPTTLGRDRGQGFVEVFQEFGFRAGADDGPDHFAAVEQDEGRQRHHR